MGCRTIASLLPGHVSGEHRGWPSPPCGRSDHTAHPGQEAQAGPLLGARQHSDHGFRPGRDQGHQGLLCGGGTTKEGFGDCTTSQEPRRNGLGRAAEGHHPKRRTRRQLSQADGKKPYITACFKQLPTSFTLGTEHRHSSCESKPLEPGQEYVFFLLAELNTTAVKMFAASPYTDLVVTPELEADPLPMETGGDGLIWVVGPVLAVVFIICIVIAILLYKNSKPDSRKRKESEPRTKCLLNNAEITPTTHRPSGDETH
ncbi:receptor-type tyrosine-protein phosphatase S-like [Oncorhynchus tshawytscha]|uniref:receptor-type tyrosine-protein phosphatase S-like n=1 Tax=Oncorhynchus tshawytscha TaxID=74940 RepID=UPI001C3D0A74|nr:receptor-type tyrosine-protein phosphatase S-like [Oncorhynchus tshawytscha]